jgi:hypothetical protein
MLTPSELAPLLAASLQKITDARNASEILEYNQAVTLYTKIYGVNPNPNSPPPPTPPQIEILNQNLVMELETKSDTNDADWLAIYSYETYKPVTPPSPSINLPTLVVEPFGPGYPGYFELAPDSPSVTPGTSVIINGITYNKENIGQSPFSPTGFITAWKQQPQIPVQTVKAVNK